MVINPDGQTQQVAGITLAACTVAIPTPQVTGISLTDIRQVYLIQPVDIIISAVTQRAIKILLLITISLSVTRQDMRIQPVQKIILLVPRQDAITQQVITISS